MTSGTSGWNPVGWLVGWAEETKVVSSGWFVMWNSQVKDTWNEQGKRSALLTVFGRIVHTNRDAMLKKNFNTLTGGGLFVFGAIKWHTYTSLSIFAAHTRMAAVLFHFFCKCLCGHLYAYARGTPCDGIVDICSTHMYGSGPSSFCTWTCTCGWVYAYVRGIPCDGIVDISPHRTHTSKSCNHSRCTRVSLHAEHSAQKSWRSRASRTPSWCRTCCQTTS